MNSFFPIMFLIFMTLKLTDCIDWSWIWVTAPLWMPFTVVIVLAVISAIIKYSEQ